MTVRKKTLKIGQHLGSSRQSTVAGRRVSAYQPYRPCPLVIGRGAPMDTADSVDATQQWKTILFAFPCALCAFVCLSEDLLLYVILEGLAGDPSTLAGAPASRSSSPSRPATSNERDADADALQTCSASSNTYWNSCCAGCVKFVGALQ